MHHTNDNFFKNKHTNMLCSTIIHVHAGGALGGDVLHAAEPWGLGLSWGDANVTGALFIYVLVLCGMTHAKAADVSNAVCHAVLPSAHTCLSPREQVVAHCLVIKAADSCCNSS